MIDEAQSLEMVKQHKLIAILRGVPAEKLVPAAEALYRGGVRLIECTYDHALSDCVDANRAMIAALAQHFEGRMLAGAGTVMTEAEVDAAVEAGAAFIVSPNVDAAVIRRTRERGALSMPGAMTPTEIAQAYAAGAHYVKLFPAGELGLGYIKAVRAPLHHIPMLAVGGVEPGNVVDFLKAGISGFGVGSPIAPKAEIDRGDWAAIEARARSFVEAIARA